MKVFFTILSIAFSALSLAQTTTDSSIESPSILVSGKLEYGAFFAKESYGNTPALALQFDAPKYSFVARLGTNQGSDLLTNNTLDYKQASVHLRKQSSGSGMRLFASAGLAYAWGDLNQTNDNRNLEIANPAKQEMICLPLSAGFQLLFCDYVGIEIGGYYAPSLSESTGGLRAGLLIGQLR